MSFNLCRSVAFEAFRDTLAALRGVAGTSEVEFRSLWLDRLSREPSVYASGWYDPPPYGIAVLSASDKDPTRISYGSLREAPFWPGDTKIDWDGFLFAYSSCVSRTTGLIGDFDLTLYFGSNAEYRSHYCRCFDAVDRLLKTIMPQDTSQLIFERSEAIFAEAGLKNCVISVSDATPLDLGHTYPSLTHAILGEGRAELSPDAKNSLRAGRRFINKEMDWPLTDGVQFTIEPQLRSVSDPSMPQISFHYLLCFQDGRIDICRDIDELIRPLL